MHPFKDTPHSPGGVEYPKKTKIAPWQFFFLLQQSRSRSTSLPDQFFRDLPLPERARFEAHMLEKENQYMESTKALAAAGSAASIAYEALDDAAMHFFSSEEEAQVAIARLQFAIALIEGGVHPESADSFAKRVGNVLRKKYVDFEDRVRSNGRSKRVFPKFDDGDR